MPSDEDSAPPARRRTPPVDPRLLRYARASRGFFVAIGVIGAAQTVTIVAFAWLLTRAVVGAIDGMPWSELTETLGGLAGIVGLRALLVWLRETVAARAAAHVEEQLRAHLVEAVGVLGPAWLETRNTAQLAVTAGRGLDALDAYFGRYLPQLVQTVIATPVVLLVMWWQDWISGLTVLLTLPLIPIFMVLIGLATRAVQERQWQTLQRLASRFADTVQGLSTLTVFGRQHRAAASIEKVTETYRIETMRVLRVSFLSGFALEFLASISVAIVAVSIGFRLLDGSLALGVGLFVLLLAPEAYLPLRQVGVQFHAAAEGVAATDDVFEVLDAARDEARIRPLDGRDTPLAEPPARRVLEARRPASGLSVRGMRVRRGDGMLPPVDLVALPGTVTLVEGPSGSGKSSILAALRGAALFDGAATYEGRDVRALAPSQWLAWAGQQAGLVAGTVASNVALGDPAPDSDRVRRALDLAGARLLDPARGLGVQGAGLSGGQAQRVAVARAFYRRLAGHAGVIALDEPSAALDAATEAALWVSVRTLAGDGAVVLLVSHRTTARTIADSVVRLESIEAIA
ncbi:thiol reductant ABC exporter subunit CydD [Microbacterium ulmi]|uniref:Thiol reductant ABC exporter subunit CydD n=1 Tax=Microbacterium ulmi TaxID=179095 RepID=A0A7Y2Q0X3_9MICO|nr:thiol reductant ABC exporter subunit CydD [Microbacterium ulmi]NII68638.1 ATP-binding cassette subfamily C protein CydD [Microbacterium ulmi]NNH04808.1 thiol reductant ABC exporter subunit CydD [Microbacterium ulmi]